MVTLPERDQGGDGVWGLLLLLSLFLGAGCSGLTYGQWVWVHADPDYAEQNRRRDIYECEEYALTMKDDHFDKGPFFGRDYGGWGDFDFEFCMHERGWRQEFREPTVD